MHCPSGSHVVSSKYSLFKLLRRPDFVTYHRFCPTCFEYIGNMENVSNIRSCGECNSVLPCTGQNIIGTFVEFDLKWQLQDLLGRFPCLSDERTWSSRNLNVDLVIRSLKDGERYQDFTLMSSANDVIDLSYSWAMDALQVFKTSKYQATPIYLKINELPDRVKKSEILCAGVWYGKEKAVSKSFLKPFIERLNQTKGLGH